MSRRSATRLGLFAVLGALAAFGAFSACGSPGSAPGATDAGSSGDAGGAPDGGDAGPAFVDAGMDAGEDAGVDAGTCDSLSGTGGTQACRMCAENAGTCQGDITTYESACVSYTTCICGCGGGTSCAAGCLQSSTTNACKSALAALAGCAEQACPAECSGPDAGPLPDGGNWCSSLAGCCAMLDGGTPLALCNAAVNNGNAAKCEQAWKGLCQ